MRTSELPLQCLVDRYRSLYIIKQQRNYYLCDNLYYEKCYYNFSLVTRD